LELRDVQRVVTWKPRASMRARVRGKEAGRIDRATECQSIGGVRLVSIDIEPFKAGEEEWLCVKPGAVGKEAVLPPRWVRRTSDEDSR